MTKKEYEKKIVELQAQIDELKNTQIEETNSALPTPPHPRWRPKKDEEYWFISSSEGSYSWDDDDSDHEFYAAGNVFKTREAAVFALERRKVLAEMWEWAGKWDDAYILRCDETRKIETYSLISPHKSYGEMRFATKEDAENCIKAVGEDRIRKYYFMIPEDKSNA